MIVTQTSRYTFGPPANCSKAKFGQRETISRVQLILNKNCQNRASTVRHWQDHIISKIYNQRTLTYERSEQQSHDTARYSETIRLANIQGPD
jgi:hypothetical protein